MIIYNNCINCLLNHKLCYDQQSNENENNEVKSNVAANKTTSQQVKVVSWK